MKPFARRAPHPEQSLATLTEAMYRPNRWRRRLSESFTLTEGAISTRNIRIECCPPCVLASELGLEGMKDQILVPVAIAKKFTHLAFQVKIVDGKGDVLPSLEHKKSDTIALKILHYAAKKSSVIITDSELEQLIDL
ncbi:MAG: hypothetical protein QG622_3130 [Actinomycetota bacterium]|nr:hypothetical protein [Actinomycetota bacterium]